MRSICVEDVLAVVVEIRDDLDRLGERADDDRPLADPGDEPPRGPPDRRDDRRGLAAIVDEHGDWIVGDAHRQHFALIIAFRDDEIIGADIHRRAIVAVGDCGEHDASSGLLSSSCDCGRRDEQHQQDGVHTRTPPRTEIGVARSSSTERQICP